MGVVLSRVYLTYPVVAVLVLAAALPIAFPSVFVDSAPAPVSSLTRASAPVVVSTSAGLGAAAATGPGAPAPTDDRWWRAQVARVMTTTSVVTVPNPPAAPPPSVWTTPSDRSEPVSHVPQTVRATPTELRLTSRVPAQIRRWEPLILRASKKYDVDPALIAAVIMTESSGDAEAVSPMGAVGLMQVLDGPADPEANVDEGVRMLSSYLKKFGSIDVALAAYNAGLGNVMRHGGIPPFQETHDHIARTISSYVAWRAV